MRGREHCMKQFLIIALAVFFGGCTTYWIHPLKGDLEFEHEYAFCEALAGAAVQGMMSDKYWLIFAELGRVLTEKQVMESCMQRKGWSQTSALGAHRVDIMSKLIGIPLLP
jgi:hypothetical protein